MTGSAEGAKLSLKTNKRLVVYKQHAQLSGRLAGGKRGVKIALRADSFPYGKSKTVARTRTRKSGRFGFRVKPVVGTNYRAVVDARPGVNSPLARVFVVPRARQSCNLCGDKSPTHAGNYTLRVKLHILYGKRSSARKADGQRAYFYYALNRGSGAPHRLKRVQRTRERLVHGRRSIVSFAYKQHIPNPPYRTAFAPCVRDSPRSTGIGLPGDHRCGDRKIPYRHGYLGRSASADAGQLGRPGR